MNHILSTLVDDTPRQQFLVQLLQALWQRYRNRVAWVSVYERLVHDAGATFFNDHIALRTIASQVPLAGIATLGRIFEALGYYAAGTYQFPDKFLSAVHLEHPNRNLPKIFISELQLAALPAATRETILRTVRTQRLPISDETLATLAQLDDHPEQLSDSLVQRVVAEFHELPWNLPEKADVLAVNQVSQYGAWVLVHGYNVNHFTSLINSQGAGALCDIERTAAALAAAGVPMKAEIEGLVGSRLRQTATEAVVIDVPVAENGLQGSMPWSYAYFELAERGTWLNPSTGLTERFEGFLGSQATQLFDLTRVKRQE
jgi:hypothetical protein